MATFFVDATGTVVSASSGADSIYVQSGALQGSTILGLGGNDTINLKEPVINGSAAAGPIIKGAAGDDSIYIASANYSAGYSIYGGSGTDTVTIAGSGGIASLKTNEGNDLVTLLDGGTTTFVAGGAGADTINLSGTAASVYGGNGHDLISGGLITLATAARIRLGDGKDTISPMDLGGQSAASIIGDSTDAGLADVIDLNSTVTGLTVKGAAGADSIGISGVTVSSFYAGNAGADSIGFVDALAADVIVRGGDGADTVTLQELAATTAEVFGGAGADSVYVDAITDDRDATKTTFVGGAGADSITFSGAAVTSGSIVGTFLFSAFSDSNLAGFDQVDAGDANTSGFSKAVFDFSNNASAAGAYGAVTAATLFGSVDNRATIDSNAMVVLSGTLNVSSVTAVAGTVDTLTLSAGAATTVLFKTKGGDEYLFMQGGSTGTDDDAIVSFAGLSALSVAAGASTSAATVTFSGAASTN